LRGERKNESENSGEKERWVRACCCRPPPRRERGKDSEFWGKSE